MKPDTLLSTWQTAHYRCDKEHNAPVVDGNALGTSPSLYLRGIPHTSVRVQYTLSRQTLMTLELLLWAIQSLCFKPVIKNV